MTAAALKLMMDESQAKDVHGFLIYDLRIDFSRCPKAVNDF